VIELAVGFLGLRSGFGLAALFVSWGAIALLAIVVANLHSRLRRLESKEAAATPVRGMQRWVGRALPGVTRDEIGASVRTILFLSDHCPTCRRIVEALGRVPVDPSFAVASIDSTEPPDGLAPEIRFLDRGPEIGRELDIRLTPLRIVLDAEGRVDRAAPLGSVDELALALPSDRLESVPIS